ncbi:hypothetical protein H0A58_10845 [Alcaligenaceae bacterium]|nr:hypothetical protein [Alcaligenaceae bacterium]
MNTSNRTRRIGFGSTSLSGVSRKRIGTPHWSSMLTDVVLAAAWAAMIPGLLWLGAVGGF